MQAIIHVGLPKTGTTTLQQTFRSSYDYLVECGVLYPRNPPSCRFASHKILASIVIPEEKYGRDLRGLAPDQLQLARLQDEFLRSVADQCAEHRPQTLIISAEHLSNRHVQPARLSDTLGALGATVSLAVVYCRRPSAHFLSRAQQWIKASWLLPSYHKPLVEMLDLYRAQLGGNAVSVRVFDRRQLLNGDIVDDFCGHVLEPRGVTAEDLTRGKYSNETLSAESMSLLIDFRKMFYPDANDLKTVDTRKLTRVLRNADASVGASRPTLLPGIAEAIDYSSDDPLTLRDNFGVEFADFDYGRLEAGNLAEPPPPGAPLHTLVALDNDIRARIVQEVTESDWAMEEEQRQDWVRGLGS